MILKIVHSPVAATYKEAAEITTWFDGKPESAGARRFTGWERGNQVWDVPFPESGSEAYIMTNDGRTFEHFYGGPCDASGALIPQKAAA